MQKELSINNLIYIIQKFQKYGFEGLSLSDLAIAVSVPEFRDHFIRNTGHDWATKYEIKALQKLQSAHYDMQWMISKEEQSQKPFFSACIKGDIQHVKDILRRQDISSLRVAVDRNKKTALHLAVEYDHSVLAEFLINQGFNPNSRDRVLKTPLHYCCQKGIEYIFNVLEQNGADIEATDGYNRTILHYACCGSSNIIVGLICGLKSNLINKLDNNQISPLQYAILNSSTKQIEIIRTLIENGADINHRDSEGKTALFHAAYQGKSRVIPILLKNKADINISDYEQLQTPLDVAANQRTRELLIVYSHNQNNDNEPKKEDLQWMNAAIKGEKIDGSQQGNKLFQPLKGNFTQTGDSKINEQQQFNKTSQQMKGTMEQEMINNNQEITLQSTLRNQKETMSNLSRERFFQMMKKIQEEGVTNYQHIKKPYIYTGSWMEGVQNLGDLYTVIQEISSTEAVLCIFNLLCPYDKPLPQDDGQEAIDGFYGDPWKQALKSPLEDKLEREKKLQAQLTNIDQLKKKLREKEKNLTDQVYECKELTKDNESLRQQLEKLQNQPAPSVPLHVEDDLKGKEVELTKLRKKVAELKQELKEKQMTIEQLEKMENDEQNNHDNLENIEKIIHLEEELRIEKQKNKVQRFKSGQLFLKTLSQGGIKKSKQGGSKFNQDNLQDDDAIIRMFNALKDNPPNFIQRLQMVDKNGDNKINVHEFIEFCNKLKLSQQDIMSLQRVVGFQDGRKLLGIQEFQTILQRRPQERQEAEERLFKKIIDAFQAKNKTLEEVFEEIDTDGSGEISSSEFRVGLEKLKIILNQKDLNNIFCIFDKDKSNSISLEEMRETINVYKQKLEGKFLDDELLQQDIQQQQKEQEIDYQRVSKEENWELIQEGQEVNKQTDDLISGELKVQIPRIRKFVSDGITFISLKITLRGLEKDEIIDRKQIGDKGDLFYAFKLNINHQKPENLDDYLQIEIYKENTLNEDGYLGEVKIAWKCCILSPNEYHISREFTICNLSYPETKVKGYIGLQARFTPLTRNQAVIQIGEEEEEEYPQQLVPPKEFSPITKQKIESFADDGSTQNYKENVIRSSNRLNSKMQTIKSTSINQQQQSQKLQQPMQTSDKDLEQILSQGIDKNDLQYLENLDSDISGYVQQKQQQDKNQQLLIDDSNVDDILADSDYLQISQSQMKQMDSNISNSII